MHNHNKKIHTQKIKPMTKQDKQHICKILDTALTLCSENYNPNISWVSLLQTIDENSLYRSLAHILNAEFDRLPQKLIDSNKKLSEIQLTGRPITIFDVLSNSNTVFRFAPSPSGYLHIGHFVPLILNILLNSVTLHKGYKSDFIFRIDDTNPNEDDYSQAIKDTMARIMGNAIDDVIETRSSSMASKVIELINDNMNSDNPHFYVDLSTQPKIKAERKLKIESVYRNMSIDGKRELWQNLMSGKIKNGVVRAKINMLADIGNLRDPVMIRYVINSNGEYVLMPTYDLVCPVLDSLDSMIHSSNTNNTNNIDDINTILIALRDSNYYDRLDQYYWIQNALNLQPTAVLTFSRVNFKNTLLSKRKIKKLVTNGVVNSWSDPRLMTIDGVMNRGVTLLGLLHFYWLSSHLSVGNRPTSQHIDNLFAINDKVLSQRQNFIVDRMPENFMNLMIENFMNLVPENFNKNLDANLDFNVDEYMIISVYALVIKQIDDVETNNTNANANETDNADEDSDDKDIKETKITDKDLAKIPDIVHVKDVYCRKDRLIVCNLRHIRDLSSVKNLTSDDLNNGLALKTTYELPSDKFKCCFEIKVGDIVKINNFKNDQQEHVFHGFYHIINSIIKQVNGYDMTNLIAIHIK